MCDLGDHRYDCFGYPLSSIFIGSAEEPADSATSTASSSATRRTDKGASAHPAAAIDLFSCWEPKADACILPPQMASVKMVARARFQDAISLGTLVLTIAYPDQRHLPIVSLCSRSPNPCVTSTDLRRSLMGKCVTDWVGSHNQEYMCRRMLSLTHDTHMTRLSNRVICHCTHTGL